MGFLIKKGSDVGFLNDLYIFRGIDICVDFWVGGCFRGGGKGGKRGGVSFM